MDRFQPSRGRILFETLCALALAASLAAAWQQTGASALVAGAVAAALFGFSHAFGMKRPGRAAEPQRIAFAADDKAEPAEVEPAIVLEQQAELASLSEDVEPLERAPIPARRARKPKAPRKTRGGGKAAEKAVVAESSVAVEGEPVPEPIEDEAYTHITPLFEPEPFVRQPRAVVFGRKAG